MSHRDLNFISQLFIKEFGKLLDTSSWYPNINFNLASTYLWSPAIKEQQINRQSPELCPTFPILMMSSLWPVDRIPANKPEEDGCAWSLFNGMWLGLSIPRRLLQGLFFPSLCPSLLYSANSLTTIDYIHSSSDNLSSSGEVLNSIRSSDRGQEDIRLRLLFINDWGELFPLWLCCCPEKDHHVMEFLPKESCCPVYLWWLLSIPNSLPSRRNTPKVQLLVHCKLYSLQRI